MAPSFFGLSVGVARDRSVLMHWYYGCIAIDRENQSKKAENEKDE